MEWLLLSVFLIASFIVIYHHVGYPVALKWLAKRGQTTPPPYYHRHYRISPLDHMLPRICLIMPAHNEAAVITDKIHNLGAIDYPENKLKIIIVCDGCTDDTAELSRRAASQIENCHLDIEVVEKPQNCGKVAVLNEAISLCQCDVVALSDISALLSTDSLLIAAAQLSYEETGVVCGSYHFFHSLSVGEQAYWRYQRQIKTQESSLGATLGVHGAFYAFRRRLFEELPPDTINDDFTLPVSIVMQGYQCLYDERIMAVELEQACNEMDFSRRKRIAAGNVQQAIRHIGLLHPRFGRIAFNFFSGKFLRPLMPVFFTLVLLSSALLIKHYPIFIPIFIAQLAVYIFTVFFILFKKQPNWKLARIVYYIMSGHIAMAIGLVRYLTGLESGQWKKVTSKDKRSRAVQN
ncbi:glycosyltransferase family 2 protein [Endozoicomonas numazuensis]|uniref:glycosyltransferase family 2 protein n=1 Tax=Endozoicomonas numazuensis TaxID=1137799 RepID=UPI0005571B72|nr:glycosyltransferase family 2 protein [Endozoicomonas numazuensis]